MIDVIPLTTPTFHFLLLNRFPSGILPRDGRNISFRELSTQVRATYNFSPSFSLYVPRYIATILNRSYSTGRFDLSDIDVHNGIEHDASLVRKYQTTNILHLSPIKPSIPTFISASGTSAEPPARAEANFSVDRTRHIPAIPPGHARRGIGGRIAKVGHGSAALFQGAVAIHPTDAGPSPAKRVALFHRRGARSNSDGRF